MEQDIFKIASEALRKAALNEDAKNYILKNDLLFNVLKKAANRYIGGETIKETISTIKKLNLKGFIVTTDYMGESTRSEKDATEATSEFIQFAKAVKSEDINSSISLDLSHIGLLVSRELAVSNLKMICNEANKTNQEVIISMEGTDRTDMIINIYEEVLKTHHNLGITLQAYLHRTKEDFEKLIKLPGSIRLVKGAYETTKDLSIPRGDQLDSIYLNYVERLFTVNHKCSIASHHNKVLESTIKLIEKHSPDNYVLERLLGICNDELAVIKDRGYKCRIYVVYGKEWYLYLCNRWAEYPMSLFRGLADIVK